MSYLTSSTGTSKRNIEYKHGFEEWGCTDPDMYYLSTGAPCEENLVLCADIMEKATIHRTEKEKKYGNLYQYGPTQGDWEFRSKLAEFLSDGYGDEVEREHLFVTCGATHGLHLITTLLLPRGCVVFVEEPTYFIAIDILSSDLGFKVVSVPTTDDGIDLDEFSRLLNEHNHLSGHTASKRYPFWAMLYTVPTYSNPTGRVTTPACMQGMVSLARQHGILVLSDDVYNLLHYDDSPHPPKRLFAYDKCSDGDYKGNVVSNGSFSKILAPGLRLGWFEAPERVVDLILETHVLRSGGSCNHYLSGVMASALSLGLQQRHISHLRSVYKGNMDAVHAVLQRNLPPTVHYSKPKGGYFIWVTLPPGSDANILCVTAQNKYRVDFKTGSQFSNMGKYKECLRIAVTHYNEATLVKATNALCKAITEYLS